MADQISPERRSAVMRRIKSKDTAPEVKVRQALHRLGLRFRLHRKDLPGKPDIVLPKHRAAVFVHGCFWHQHPGCRRASKPKSRNDYWDAKLRKNVERDAQTPAALAAFGWRHIVIWECEVNGSEKFAADLAAQIRCDPAI